MRYDEHLLKSLATSLLSRCGVPEQDALVTSGVLVAAEMRGIPSHGLLRLNDYLRMLCSGRINSRPRMKLVHETVSTGTLDGDNGLGPVVARHAMELAIGKAGEAGTAWVAVLNSNHFGIAAYYAMMALEHRMIGLCMCNANPLVAPTFSAEGMLGTNPLAVAVPAGSEPPMVADFATAVIARGKVDLLHKQGLTIEPGFVQEPDGSPSEDPGVLGRGGAILPLGSTRQYGSHKGYCMAAVVDVLSAVLPGANFGPFVPPSVDWLPVKADLPGKGTGHLFGAFRVDAFRPGQAFLDAMDHWIQTMRSATPAKGHDRVLIPGDPEREAERRHGQTGVSIKPQVKEQLRHWCEKLKIGYPL